MDASTLREQRMINAHKMGRRDYREGRPMLVPAFLTDQEETDSYRAGWLGEQRRAAKGGI